MRLLPLSLLFVLPYVWAEPHCALAPPHLPGSIRQSGGPGAGGAGTGGGGASGGGASGSLNTSDHVVASAWYPGWHGAQFTPENVTWSSYNDIKYAFACVHHAFLKS
jgi:chitinase